MEDLRRLRAFVIIAEEMNLTRAAKLLHMAQPHLTRLLQHLEDDLGFPLFDRSPKRQLTLTPAGENFLTRITPMLKQYEEAVQAAQRVALGEGGKLVVGYVAAAMFNCLLPAIIQAYRRFPWVELITRDLAKHPLSSQLKALREHRLDAAFLYAPFDDQGIAHECIDRAGWVIALPAHHPLASLEAVPLAALSEEPWIWGGRSFHPQNDNTSLSLCQQAGFEPRIVETVAGGQPHTMISLVAARLGVALVTEWTQHCLAVPEVVYRPLLGSSYTLELHLVWRKDDSSPLMQTFLQVVHEVREKLEKLPGQKEAVG